MNSLIWLFDKIIDVVAPRIIFRLREAWRKKPIQTSVVLVVTLSIMAASGSILNTFLYMPILFLEDDRPVRLYNYSRAKDELKLINEQLVNDAQIIIEASKSSLDNHDHSWTYAGLLVALGPAQVSEKLKHDHGAFFRKWMKPDRHCWADYGKPTGPCHLGPTAWVLMAMSINSIKPNAEMWRYVLDQQDRLGWWSLYEDSGFQSQNASVYSTAVALWALHTGLETNVIPDGLIGRSKVSVGRAKNWLYSKLDRSNCLWFPYPDRASTSEPSVAISAFALNVLLTVDQGPINRMESRCLSALTSRQVAITELYTTGENIALDDGRSTEKDAVRHQELIMTLLALSKLYPMLSITDKAQVRKFVEIALFPDPAAIDSKLEEPWQKAELAMAVRSILDDSHSEANSY